MGEREENTTGLAGPIALVWHALIRGREDGRTPTAGFGHLAPVFISCEAPEASEGVHFVTPVRFRARGPGSVP